MSPKGKTRLIVLSAPSGGGKTTLARMLLDAFPNITRNVSTTTRARRPNELDGVHYHFVTPDEFQRKIDAGDFAEWAEVHGNHYGISKSTIDAGLSSGRHILFDIDYQGAMTLRRLYASRTLLIFILPPNMDTLEKRLRERGSDNPQVIATRLQNAYNEVQWSGTFDHRITNDDLNRAFRELSEIVKRECP